MTMLMTPETAKARALQLFTALDTADQECLNTVGAGGDAWALASKRRRAAFEALRDESVTLLRHVTGFTYTAGDAKAEYPL
jgi:hypothetical protein